MTSTISFLFDCVLVCVCVCRTPSSFAVKRKSCSFNIFVKMMLRSFVRSSCLFFRFFVLRFTLTLTSDVRIVAAEQRQHKSTFLTHSHSLCVHSFQLQFDVFRYPRQNISFIFNPLPPFCSYVIVSSHICPVLFDTKVDKTTRAKKEQHTQTNRTSYEEEMKQIGNTNQFYFNNMNKRSHTHTLLRTSIYGKLQLGDMSL